MGDPVTDTVGLDFIHDLWGIGFTIVPRPRHIDPMHVDPAIIPKDRSYQWMHLEHDKIHFLDSEGQCNRGWAPVPYARHPGVFAPWGTGGNIEVSGCGLFEKPKFEVDAERAQTLTRVKHQVDDWAMKAAANGITGTIRTGVGSAPDKLMTMEEIAIGPEGKIETVSSTPYERQASKTIETTVSIPPEMFPHMGRIFAERDRLEGEVVRKDRTLVPGDIADKFYDAIKADKAAPWWPTLRAILLPIAVENVRAELNKETTNG